LTAKRARYYPNTGDVVVNDSVRVITKDNDTMYTRKLLYSEKLQKIYTTDSVRIQNGPQVTTGAYLEANKDFTWVRIYNQKGVIPVNDEDMNIAD
jgi:LPS export ABC transporter protein LptC